MLALSTNNLLGKDVQLFRVCMTMESKLQIMCSRVCWMVSCFVKCVNNRAAFERTSIKSRRTLQTIVPIVDYSDKATKLKAQNNRAYHMESFSQWNYA